MEPPVALWCPAMCKFITDPSGFKELKEQIMGSAGIISYLLLQLIVPEVLILPYQCRLQEMRQTREHITTKQKILSTI
ncbi:L3 protein [Bos taurus papillomavirus 12]|uniref:L3 protein n=1 Tax=Bos taurus papillomavirus 12 TaxID=1070324 RepID=G1CR78_9PAPI|nr:L3 protein [Bos taurus papillomavirus 12]AEL99910.1 L3 protein [Bos taurus papillomavirus 12]AEL99913.1 L3 protein [Bos taurus papillomavirus 12]